MWVLVPSLSLGFLLVGNSWDFPTYAGLFWLGSVLALFPAAWAVGNVASILRRQVPSLLAVSACAVLLYLPFLVGFGSQVRGIAIPADRTPLVSMLIIFGPFLFVLLALLLWRVVERQGSGPLLASLRWGGVLLLLSSWWLGSIGLISGALLLAVGALAAILRESASSGSGDGTGEVATAPEGSADSLDTSATARAFLLLMTLLGLLLVLGPELVFLVDSFGTRMNTVFKLHYQAWQLLGLAAGHIPGLDAWGSPCGGSPPSPRPGSGIDDRHRSAVSSGCYPLEDPGPPRVAHPGRRRLLPVRSAGRLRGDQLALGAGGWAAGGPGGDRRPVFRVRQGLNLLRFADGPGLGRP